MTIVLLSGERFVSYCLISPIAFITSTDTLLCLVQSTVPVERGVYLIRLLRPISFALQHLVLEVSGLEKVSRNLGDKEISRECLRFDKSSCHQ